MHYSGSIADVTAKGRDALGEPCVGKRERLEPVDGIAVQVFLVIVHSHQCPLHQRVEAALRVQPEAAVRRPRLAGAVGVALGLPHW